jgi:hypothetical protein
MSDQERTLRIEIPPSAATKLIGENDWTGIDLLNGWSTPLGGTVLIWQGEIDLSGYSRDMKTFYPSAGMIQQGMFFLQEGGEGAWVITTVSSTPIDLEELILSTSFGSGLGFLSMGGGLGLPGNQNWETVIFNETQLYVNNTNISPNTIGVQQKLNVEQTGSLSPTASDTLYVSKVIIPQGSDMTSINIPASRVLLPGKFGTEPDVEYMMRLKRSTELSQQV